MTARFQPRQDCSAPAQALGFYTLKSPVTPVQHLLDTLTLLSKQIHLLIQEVFPSLLPKFSPFWWCAAFASVCLKRREHVFASIPPLRVSGKINKVESFLKYLMSSSGARFTTQPNVHVLPSWKWWVLGGVAVQRENILDASLLSLHQSFMSSFTRWSYVFPSHRRISLVCPLFWELQGRACPWASLPPLHCCKTAPVWKGHNKTQNLASIIDNWDFIFSLSKGSTEAWNLPQWVSFQNLPSLL